MSVQSAFRHNVKLLLIYNNYCKMRCCGMLNILSETAIYTSFNCNFYNYNLKTIVPTLLQIKSMLNVCQLFYEMNTSLGQYFKYVLISWKWASVVLFSIKNTDNWNKYFDLTPKNIVHRYLSGVVYFSTMYSFGAIKHEHTSLVCLV